MRGASETASAASPRRQVVYCLLPRELADPLHDLLREHFAEDSEVEVVVERRTADRRRRAERRAGKGEAPGGDERRTVRARAGRRVAERRAAQVPVESRKLPRRARRHAGAITFVARQEPSTQKAEDADSARVIARVQAGDSEAFSTIYSRYFDRIYAYMRTVMRDRDEAEDATQEVFVRVLEGLRKYKPGESPFRAWLFTIVRNHAINELRKLGRMEPIDPVELAERTEAPVEDEQHLSALDWITDRDLQVFVQRLSVPQRQALALRFLLDLRDEQIAALLDRTPGDIRALQSRALRFLEERLTAIGRAPEDAERRKPWKTRRKQAPVLRNRRFALVEKPPGQRF